ncbi:hypothetical protein ATH84_107113 [Paracoccus versutus]|uniref:Uncharacterized protein n=1 Tax=Paracoccus versutus TaxID=34007 RepID=A0AAQ0HCR7_PARVE|nr:hypothetical protein ATH84_107113 [Paracoccus versutus]
MPVGARRHGGRLRGFRPRMESPPRHDARAAPVFQSLALKKGPSFAIASPTRSGLS